MSSGSQQGGSGVYTPPPVPSHRNRTFAIVIVVIVAAAAVAGVYFLGGFGSSNKEPWLFDGAYATYSGETSPPSLSITFNLTIRVQVVAFNSTAVETLSYYTLKYGIHTDTNQSTQWHQLNSSGGIEFTQPSGYTLSRTSSTTRLVSGNVYYCTAYEYTKGKTTLTEYVSNSVDFPVEFTYSAPALGGILDLPLVQTNVSGL